MKNISAGLLLFRKKSRATEFFLVHPGGPFWAKKDAGAWTIPKGLVSPREDLLSAARREFREETGFTPEGKFLSLGSFRQPSGKVIHVWAVEGNCDPALLTSNAFPLEWPPGSGNVVEFPEIDRAGWFTLEQAAEKLLRGQIPILAAFMDSARSLRAASRRGMKTTTSGHKRSSKRRRAHAASGKKAKPKARQPRRD